MGQGYLVVKLFLADQAMPVENLEVLIYDEAGNLLHTLITDQNGVTEKVALAAPNKEHAFDPYNGALRYGIYRVEVPLSEGLQRTIVHNVEIFDTVDTTLPIQMQPAIVGNTPEQNTEEIFIPLEHGVDLPDQRALSQINQESARQASEFGPIELAEIAPAISTPIERSLFGTPTTPVLANEVAIPSHITVHLGRPNATAPTVRVPFIDYIKNVACSEIYPTWEDAALYANIYCQISFALNRLYTRWYPSQGFNFDITNSTSVDQFYVHGREIFENISQIVDRIFNMFLRRQGFREPFIAQYCNGTTSTCAGLSQWGSQFLALRGFTPIEILHYYFPNDINIVESTNFAEGVGSFGGVPLREGSVGDDVHTMQIYLNRISGNFFIPPVGFPEGVFRSSTTEAVRAFQNINNLPVTGIIDKDTWYAITRIYFAVRRVAELDSEGRRIGIGTTPPRTVLRLNARGRYVVELQFLLNFISAYLPDIPFVVENGVYREETRDAVIAFQRHFNLLVDGITGPQTWGKLYEVYWSIQDDLAANSGPAANS